MRSITRRIGKLSESVQSIIRPDNHERVARLFFQCLSEILNNSACLADIEQAYRDAGADERTIRYYRDGFFKRVTDGLSTEVVVGA